MSRTLNLFWEGPYRLRDFIRSNELKERFSCAGVYIWIDKLPDGSERLSYVGKAGGRPSLHHRQQQHYANMVGGLYTIPKEYRQSNEAWVPNWSLPTVAEVILDREKYQKVIDEGFAYEAACQVYLATLDSADESKIVERQLLYDLQPSSTSWGTKSAPNSPIDIVHIDANWATQAIRSDLPDGRARFA